MEDWAKICGAELVTESSQIDGKSVLSVDVKDGVGAYDLWVLRAWLMKEIATVAESVPEPYLLLLTGSHSHSKRQGKEVPLPSSVTSTAAKHATSTSTHTGLPDPKAPLLQRVQLLTTPIITALLVSFFILLPILYVGITALSGIQVPPRLLEISKTSVSKDKKDQ